jgi:hypothetical protein
VVSTRHITSPANPREETRTVVANGKDDDLYDVVSGMADRIGLEGKERSQYIHNHMTRGGYRAVPNYVKDDGEGKDEDTGGGFFASSSRRKRSDQRKSSDEEDWYGG